MFRALIAFGVLPLFATVASAQPGRLPLSPGVMPASPFGPGMPARPAVPPPGQAGTVFVPVIAPWGWGVGWNYPTYNPWTGYGYSFGGVLPQLPVVPQQQVIVEPPRRPDPVVILAQEFPATLTLQFPAAADVWLDGKKVEGKAGEERVLTSPVLKAGAQYTFAVKAQWTRAGKTYEAKRSVTLGSGDRSRVFIVSGEEVRE